MTRGTGSTQALRGRAVVLLVLAWGVGGCAAHGAAIVEDARTDEGVIRMDASVRRNLSVLEHRCRRDRLGRLTVSVRFGNSSGAAFPARVRVKFRNRDGTWEGAAGEADEQEFPPGESVLECTSYEEEAVGYEVEIRSGRFFLW